jgi:hypothetical protein
MIGYELFISPSSVILTQELAEILELTDTCVIIIHLLVFVSLS